MKITTSIFLLYLASRILAQDAIPGKIIPPPPVLGLAIAAPQAGHVEEFIRFMEDVLVPGGINTLVLRVDYNYAYESFPELRGDHPLSRSDVRKLAEAAGKGGIRIIPQINLLGHQSWQSRMGKLLEVYPEFDENPSVKLPEDYVWPNADGLYCKSYCPQHPEVHSVVFALVDELMDAFEARDFHAGMDEVFYLGEEECPRCAGKDRAQLFAGEVNRIREHLAARGAGLWIWGDRLLDGAGTGLGMWEASENGTHGAIDLIHKDVVVCDWHYERADPTAAYFALKGFRVITCPWNRQGVTRAQLEMTDMFRGQATPVLRDRYYGFMQTVWSPAEAFIREYWELSPDGTPGEKSPAASFRAMIRHYGN